MSELVIEKGVAVPPPRGMRRLYPFNEMEVGDSFFVPYGVFVEEFSGRELEIIKKRVQTKVSAAANFHARGPGRVPNGKKFAVRRVPTGVRCWRIA